MPENYNDLVLINNTGAHQFEWHVNDQLVRMGYTIKDGVYHLMHTEVPKALEGKGIASAFVESVLKWLEKNNFKMKAFCPFVVAYLKRHPEWNRLLSTGY